MERKIKRVAVIGGANMDICGSPAGQLVPRDSNPGTVTVRPGGVGRNIAHDLRLLGVEVSLITAVGGDVYGAGLLENCRSLGIDMSMSLVLPEQRSSTYLYVTDQRGEMQTAVADMEITEHITPRALAPLMAQINRADAVLIDCNLSAETLRYVAQRCTAPLYADPVSTAKAGRLAGLLDRLTVLKPNAMEAEALTGEADPERAAKALLAAGVRRIFVTLSGDGMLAGSGDTLLHLPCYETRLVNTTGAGDAAMAALIWAELQGFGLERTARAALKAGAIACAYAGANNPALAELPKDKDL